MGSSTQGTGGSRRIDSAHGIALVALFVALGSAAYATVNLGANSVGPRQLQPNSVGPSEVQRGAIGPRQIGIGAVGGPSIQNLAVAQEHLQPNSVGIGQMLANSIGQEQLRPNSVGIGQMLANSIGQEQLQIGSVLGAAIGDGTIQPADLSAEAKSTLYTDVNDGPINVSTSSNVTVGTLNLPAGAYLVIAGASAVHNNNASSTRLECSVVAPGPVVVDSSKVRLPANAAADSLSFAKQSFGGPATLGSAGTVTYACVSTNNTSIDLTSVRLMALRVPNIVAQ